jgi:hypothetical protein
LENYYFFSPDLFGKKIEKQISAKFFLLKVHHLNDERVNMVLQQYYVEDADANYVGRYSWEEGGFYKVRMDQVLNSTLKTTIVINTLQLQ